MTVGPYEQRGGACDDEWEYAEYPLDWDDEDEDEEDDSE